MNPLIVNFEKMLSSGKDSAMLRFSLGSEYLKANAYATAIGHFEQALRLDPGYSAAWKLLGKALAAAGRANEALVAYRQGIVVAEQKGDKQAAKEMAIFAKRIEQSAQ